MSNYWTYKVVSFDGQRDELQAVLNDLGQDGWEATAIHLCWGIEPGDLSGELIMKRPTNRGQVLHDPQS
ncbi:MAG: hypothetical protein H8D74_01050 [Chloroflexi bacterium]|nr:hypothetical protein [Chloroflexota bacterium]